MSKITKVKVSYGLTKSTGVKYEFIRLDYAAEVEVDPEFDNLSRVIDVTRIDLRNKLHVDIMKEIEWEQNGPAGPSDLPPIRRG